MALVHCPECSERVAHDARTCPHCGKTLRPFPFKRMILPGVLLLGLVVAAFNGNFAEHTMPKDLYAGTAFACASSQALGMMALALAGDETDVARQCRPTWFRAVKHGFATVDVDGLSGGYSNRREDAYVAAMMSDLKNLVLAQESYFSDAGKYGNVSANQLVAPRGTLLWTPTTGVSITTHEATRGGFSATATHYSVSKTCGVFVGSAKPPHPSLTKGDVVLCW